MAETLRVVAFAPRPVRFPKSVWLRTRVRAEGETAFVEVCGCNFPRQWLECTFVVPAHCIEEEVRGDYALRAGSYKIEWCEGEATVAMTETHEASNVVLFDLPGRVTEVVQGDALVIVSVEVCVEDQRTGRHGDWWSLVAAPVGSVLCYKSFDGWRFRSFFGARFRVTQDGLELER
jgi:hypothetical protein